MRRFFAAFDSFVFKSFDILGRSSRSEYWCVMPVLWAVMLGLSWWDLRGIWNTLDGGEMPSVNPLAYGSVLFILLTAIPRITLAMRRLQDSGRKGKWAGLPYSAGFLALMGILGLATSGAFVPETDFSDFEIPAALLVNPTSTEALVLTVFEFVKNIDSIHFVGAVAPTGEVTSAIGGSATADASMLLPALFVMGMMFVYPPIALLIYLLFMTFASDNDENAYGLPTNFTHGPKSNAKGEHNAFASYAILTRTDQKPSAAEVAARKQEVHSLYEQRVLRRRQQN
ncbi:DUF805 domain-containing protein [Aliiruegeria sabulilitoris]|uniref:DUF805 domain-containing protein n=1 Tax=Aliiruegeria sabulilitoris TaxID=1510458 RepID=UPI0012E3744E|nr:DUF805 domain-containing protein [Aliiruegeria sabulilitoris]NDR57257.1 DUF805 domain-containing protein [Pseudoruegeria sp. M32A2M]